MGCSAAVVVAVVLGMVANVVVSQSVPEPLFSRGCRAQRGQFPHETYCQQYYNCWDGRATVEECPGNLLFNPAISACDYPEAVNCLARLRNPEPAITGDGRCLKQFGIFPDPTDCTAFYECSHGRAFHHRCNFYTAFDERYLVCVHAHTVECAGRGGVYGTLAPPPLRFRPDAPQQIGLPPPLGSGAAASGWDRRAHQGSGSSPPFKGSTLPTSIRRSGTSTLPSSGLEGSRSPIRPGGRVSSITERIPVIPARSNIPDRSRVPSLPDRRVDVGRESQRSSGSRGYDFNTPTVNEGLLGTRGDELPRRGLMTDKPSAESGTSEPEVTISSFPTGSSTSGTSEPTGSSTPSTTRTDGSDKKDLRIQGVPGTNQGNRGVGSESASRVPGSVSRVPPRPAVGGNRENVAGGSGNRNVGGGVRSGTVGGRGTTGGREPPVGGSRGPTGGREPQVGGNRGTTGGREPPVGGNRGPTGGRETPAGGSRGPSTGREPSVGGNRGPTGGSRGQTGGINRDPSGGRGSAGNRGGAGSSGGSRVTGSTSSSASVGGAVKPGGSGSPSGFPVGSSRPQGGITGIVDKEISATGQERQYETPISPEASFRCPQPRGLYSNALDCSKFWLCREYKPSLLKCPTGQLFDLPSLACTNPEKAQCSSISPRT